MHSNEEKLTSPWRFLRISPTLLAGSLPDHTLWVPRNEFTPTLSAFLQFFFHILRNRVGFGTARRVFERYLPRAWGLPPPPARVLPKHAAGTPKTGFPQRVSWGFSQQHVFGVLYRIRGFPHRVSMDHRSVFRGYPPQSSSTGLRGEIHQISSASATVFGTHGSFFWVVDPSVLWEEN